MRAPIIRQRAAECLGASPLQIFLLVVIPSAAPYIVTGMRIAMASSFMSIIPAEILAADSGIGYPAAEVLGAAADQPHLRRAADDLRARIRRRSPVPHRRRPRCFRATCRIVRSPEHLTRRATMKTSRDDCAAVLAARVGRSDSPGRRSSAAEECRLFGQPSVNNDAIWMALENGFYKEQGLDVDYRVFPSGTTAFQTFQHRPGRHRDDRRPAERAVLLQQPRQLPDHRRDRARRQGLRRDRAQGHHQAAGPRRQDRRDARRLHRLVVHLRVPVEERRRSEEACR